MLSNATAPDFATLLNTEASTFLLEQLNELLEKRSCNSLQVVLNNSSPLAKPTYSSVEDSERIATDWLISLFDTLFIQQNVQLVRGDNEPEYFPATVANPARIEFAHGFFASALHEISHWCVAGCRRRKLSDFGYWYAADGRSQAQQQAFERVEIKPQALECLFTLACHRPFQVSQDNLFASFDTTESTFAQDVYSQVKHYVAEPQTLPPDAQTLLWALLSLN